MKAFERTPIRLALFACVTLALVWSTLGEAARSNEFRDAQVLMLYERAAVDTVKRFGQLPLWNPFYCGGLDALGSPQTRFASPTFLLSLLLGAGRAEPVIIFLLTVLGMEGTYRWLALRVERWTAALVAPVFALSGQFAVAHFRGWTNFFGFELVPWILLGVSQAARGRQRGIWIASLAFAFMIGFGGTYAAPLVAVAVVLEGLRALFDRPRSERPRALAMLAACGAFMVSCSAFRLWPMAETFWAAPRIMAGTPGHVPKAIWQALIGTLSAKDGDVELVGSFSVGAPFVALAALGLSDRRSRKVVVLLMVSVWLAAGYARKPSLFALLRELPVFAALRYPERFLWLAILFGSESAARAISQIVLMGDGRRWRRGATVVLSGAVLWSIAGEIVTFDRVAAARTLGALSTAARGEFHQTRGNRWLAAHGEALGVGSLSCWETYPVAQSPLLRADLPAEEAPAEPDAGRVKRLEWTPNQIILDVVMTREALVHINQNWHQGWHASIGKVVSHQGLLALAVPAGHHVVTLTFRPWSAVAGAAVSCAALGALGFLALRRGRKVSFVRGTGVVSTFATLAPFFVALAAFQLSPDARPTTPEPKNANGTPAIVEQVPADATPVHAGYDGGLRLEAVKLGAPSPEQTLAVDVWLSRDAAIARETAMFVFLERAAEQPAPGPDEESALRADRQVMAGSFYLSDAPRGRLVHDAFGVRLGKAAKGTWNVYVAFGHVSGKRGQLHLTSPPPERAKVGASGVDDDRVRVGSFVVR